MTDIQADKIMKKLQGLQAAAIRRSEKGAPHSPQRIAADAQSAAFGQAFYLVQEVLEEPIAELAREAAAEPGGGLAAIVGQWPGDETDEEIEQALKDLDGGQRVAKVLSDMATGPAVIRTGDGAKMWMMSLVGALVEDGICQQSVAGQICERAYP